MILFYFNIIYRDVSNIRGFTRETLIALTTTMESREWMRWTNTSLRLPPEHPQSSMTDDVECFFSLLRNMVGNHFTVKLCVEFNKRLDKDLPFYYFTSKHEQFFEGNRPNFNQYQKPKRNLCHK